MPEVVISTNTESIKSPIISVDSDTFFQDIMAMILKESEDDGVLCMTEMDNEKKAYKNYYRRTRLLLKSERIFGNTVWISAINRSLITKILDTSNPPWRILMWAEHLPKSFYPSIIEKIRSYCEMNLSEIYHSHVASRSFGSQLIHLSMFPETFGLMTDIIAVIPPKIAYQIFSGIHETYEGILAECLAKQAKPHFQQMLEKQKGKFILSVINEGFFEQIFTSLEEKAEAYDSLVYVLSKEWKYLWSQKRNEMIAGLALVLSNNPDFSQRLSGEWPLWQLPIQSLVESRSFPMTTSLSETPQQFIDFSESLNFLSWEPFVIRMAFPSDSDGIKSFERFFSKMKARGWIPEYEEAEISFLIGNVRLFLNNPNDLRWKDFLSREWKISEEESVDIVVIRWHTPYIEKYADEILSMQAKLILFWGCMWANTLIKDVIYPRFFRLNKNVRSISKSVCIAPIRIGKSEINDYILINIIEQLKDGGSYVDIGSILPETKGEYQSFSISLPEHLWEIMKNIK